VAGIEDAIPWADRQLGAMPWAIAAVIGGSVYALWHLYHRAAAAHF